MPEKQCPDCGDKVHVRKRECACGFVFPIKAKKSKSRETNPDAEYTFNGWKKVPSRSRGLKCGLCSTKMKGGMTGWHSAFDDGEKYWWCERCYK